MHNHLIKIIVIIALAINSTGIVTSASSTTSSSISSVSQRHYTNYRPGNNSSSRPGISKEKQRLLKKPTIVAVRLSTIAGRTDVISTKPMSAVVRQTLTYVTINTKTPTQRRRNPTVRWENTTNSPEKQPSRTIRPGNTSVRPRVYDKGHHNASF